MSPTVPNNEPVPAPPGGSTTDTPGEPTTAASTPATSTPAPPHAPAANASGVRWAGRGPSLEEALSRASRHAEGFVPPDGRRARLAVVTCMDRRLDVLRLFSLEPGEVYVIRNAGGILTQDVRRSLALAQYALGVEQILLIHHTDCGLCGLDDEELLAHLTAVTGIRPSWAPGGFTDVADDLRAALSELATDPHVPGGASARGFVYDVADGTLTEVER